MARSRPLSRQQRSVLKLAGQERLEWVRPVLSGGGFLSFPPWGNSPKSIVSKRTVESLVARGLLEYPKGMNHLMRITPAGESEL